MAFKRSKSNKFNAHKCVVDGHKFDSMAEANYYCELKMKKMLGEITEIELQVPFELIPKYMYKGKTVRAMKYKADFVVTYPDGHKKIIDVKGYITDEYKLKKKILLYKNPDFDFEEVTK